MSKARGVQLNRGVSADQLSAKRSDGSRHTSGLEGLTSRELRQIQAYVKKHAANQFACQHLISISRRVPHPKYGDKVPHFETAMVPDPMQCPCQEAQRFRAELKGEQ